MPCRWSPGTGYNRDKIGACSKPAHVRLSFQVGCRVATDWKKGQHMDNSTTPDAVRTSAQAGYRGDVDASDPIGIFDSGMGGLTVARSIVDALPHESVIYLGDTKRCPYGVRPVEQVRSFVAQIGAWFRSRRVKLIVIACNTATAAALPMAQMTFGVPVIGVIEPGARAAIQSTRNGRVGVIATPLTIGNDAYAHAIHAIDAGVEVSSLATPEFVTLVEGELATGAHMHDDWRRNSTVFMTDQTRSIVSRNLAPLQGTGIDTLVLGCTHFPLLAPAIHETLGPGVTIVSSAEETTRELVETLERRRQLAGSNATPTYRFATTADDITTFAAAGSFIFGRQLNSIERVEVGELEALQAQQA